MVSNSIIIGKSDLSSAVSKPSRISSKKQTSLQSGEQSGSFSDLLIDNGSPITSAKLKRMMRRHRAGKVDKRTIHQKTLVPLVTRVSLFRATA